jgi:hypothetical protein
VKKLRLSAIVTLFLALALSLCPEFALKPSLVGMLGGWTLGILIGRYYHDDL